MIMLDLKLAIFIVLVGLLGGVGGVRLMARRGAAARPGVPGLGWDGLDRLPFGVIVVNAEGEVVLANHPARQMLQKHCPEAAAQPGALLQQLGILAQSAIPRSGRLSQPLPLRWWCYPLNEQHMLVVLADDTEQQHTLRRQQTFIGQLSHELRTPLTGLLTHIEILRSPQTSEVVRQESLATIQRETQRLARLVRDMLELYRLEVANDLPLEPTNLVLVAEDAIASVILRAEEHERWLSFAADAALPPVLAQPDRLKQVFVNLLDNAIKYGRPGDTISVRLEAQSIGVLCVVEDSGPGIAASDLPRVTERLYRGRTDSEGSGMGLALVSEILRHHHTTLEITSTTEGPATGTTCRWMLPYATPMSSSAPSSPGVPDQQSAP